MNPGQLQLRANPRDLITSRMRAYRVMITQASIDGQTVGPYGRLRFGLHLSEFVSFGKEASQDSQGSHAGSTGGPQVSKPGSGLW